MTKGKRGNLYDDDDFSDYDEDEDYDADDYPAQAAQSKPTKSVAKPQPKPAPAAAAGASSLAQVLCDAPPLRPNGKLQKGARKEPAMPKPQLVASYPVAPAPEKLPGTVQPFNFQNPSPDDFVLAAQQGKTLQHSTVTAAAKRGTLPSSSKPPPSIAPSAKLGNKASNPQTTPSFAAQSLADMTLDGAITTASGAAGSGGSSAASAAAQQPQQHPGSKASSEYVLEPELARACAAAESSETAASGALSSLHLVVLGHVDAGKSSLMGRLLHDLGHVSTKEAHKNARNAAAVGKASFSWAWVLDERPEERQRGVTVDIAQARFSTQRFNVTLLDAPGHRDFVPNMIGGAAQADAALLLVDGSLGGFEAGFEAPAAGSPCGGQTREHAQLARSLGVEQLAVVVSKLDTCDYSQDRFLWIQSQLLPFLRGCGFKDSAITWLPAVGPAGENLTGPPTEPRLAAWWQGPCLVQAIDGFTARQRNIGKPLRLPIIDSSKGRVGGKLESGAVMVGSRVMVMPGGELATVKGIEVAGQPASLARAGDSVELVLSGMSDSASLPMGAVLCHPDYPVPLVTKFEARVVVLEVPGPIINGAQVTLHAHSAREAGVVSALLQLLNGKTGEVLRARPRCLMKGQTGLVELTAARPMCLEEYAQHKALGRLAVREGGRTVAVGIITRLIQ